MLEVRFTSEFFFEIRKYLRNNSKGSHYPQEWTEMEQKWTEMELLLLSNLVLRSLKYIFRII